MIKTGQAIRRPWYQATSEKNPYNLSDNNSIENTRQFPPDTLISEAGAIVCRVSKSFLRFGHLELFAIRKEWKELIQLLDFVCYREYPLLIATHSQEEIDLESWKSSLPEQIPAGTPQRYIELYRCIAKRTAFLVSEWIRVGYVQGNMNSDNTLIGGRTVDYGPYGWMERFDPEYQPFTSDPVGRFNFLNQPEAMGLNVLVLGEITDFCSFPNFQLIFVFF